MFFNKKENFEFWLTEKQPMLDGKSPKEIIKLPNGIENLKVYLLKVTQDYVIQQFNAAIGRGGFTIKNDGTVKNITVFLNDGSSFKLDLTKLK